MQETVVLPPLPQSPTPPALPSGTFARLGNVTVQLPSTSEEVEGLRNKAELIREQLEATTSRRDELARELRNGMAEEARGGVQKRIEVLDEQILQMERDQAVIEQTLINTPSALLAETQVNEPDYSNFVDEDEATAWAFFALGFGIVSTLVISRIRRRFGRKRSQAHAAAFVPADPRIDKLAEAVDAIAEEVERIGEGQRFVTNLLADRREPVAIGRDAR